MALDELQQRQFRERIAKLNRKSADLEELRFKPAPINSNMRLIGIISVGALILGMFGYAGMIAMEARSIAQAEAKTNAPIRPVMIQLDKK